MTIRWLLATFHLLALGIGLSAVWGRGRALRGTLDPAGLKLVFFTDLLWGLAGALWLVTGALRAFTGVEKGAAYYLGNPLFHAKLGLFLVIVALEIWPMVTLTRWRIRVGSGGAVDTGSARALATISNGQAVLVVAMVAVATALARGVSP